MSNKNIVKGGVAAGVAMLVVYFLINLIVMAVSPYNVLGLGGMRSATDPMMLLFFLHPFVLGLVFAYTYQYVSKSLKGKAIDKGKTYGTLMWLVFTIPSAFVVFTSMNYPIIFTIQQVIGGLVMMLVGGIVIAEMLK